MTKVKSWGRKAIAFASVTLMGCMAAVSAFASDAASNPYDAISTELQGQSTQLFTSAQTLVLGVLGGGMVLFGVFLMFKLGKRGIGAAVSSKS